MKSFKEQIAEARAAAKLEAQRLCRHKGWLQSRGASLVALNAKGDFLLGECDSWQWDGTQAGLVKAVAEAKEAGAVKLAVQGGFDWAANARDMRECGPDEPLISEWEVEIWSAA